MTMDDLIKHADLCLTYVPGAKPNVVLLTCQQDKNQVRTDCNIARSVWLLMILVIFRNGSVWKAVQ